MKKTIYLLSCAFFLTACNTTPVTSTANGVTVTKYTNPFAQFTNADAKAASALAKSENTPASLQRAKCYDYIAAQTEPIDAQSSSPGLLYLNELKYSVTVQQTNLGAECGGVLPMVLAPLPIAP